MKKEKKFKPFVGIKNLVKINGYNLAVLHRMYVAKMQETDPNFKSNYPHFTLVINGDKDLINRNLITFLCEALNVSTKELMVHYMNLGDKSEEARKKRILDERAEATLKRIEEEEIDLLMEMDHKKKTGTVPNKFKDIDSDW